MVSGKIRIFVSSALFFCLLVCAMRAHAQDTQQTIPARLTLGQAEDLLLQRNLTVAAARYQVEASRAARLIAGYKPNPVLTAGAEQITFYGPLHDMPRFFSTNS